MENTDFEKLASQSPMAHHYQQMKYDLEEILHPNFSGSYSDISQFDFHPNGISGCIISDDDYIFGIRCDHLMWMEGFVEDIYGDHANYGYTDEEINNIQSEGSISSESKSFDYPVATEYGAFPVILLIGNHKGTIIMELIRFRFS